MGSASGRPEWRRSTGSVAMPYDTELCESFFAGVRELLDRHRFGGRAEVRMAVFDFIKGSTPAPAPLGTGLPVTGRLRGRRSQGSSMTIGTVGLTGQRHRGDCSPASGLRTSEVTCPPNRDNSSLPARVGRRQGDAAGDRAVDGGWRSTTSSGRTRRSADARRRSATTGSGRPASRRRSDDRRNHQTGGPLIQDRRRMTALTAVDETSGVNGDSHPTGSTGRPARRGLTAAFASEPTEGVAQPPEYTLIYPSTCPTNQDHLMDRVLQRGTTHSALDGRTPALMGMATGPSSNPCSSTIRPQPQPTFSHFRISDVP